MEEVIKGRSLEEEVKKRINELAEEHKKIVEQKRQMLAVLDQYSRRLAEIEGSINEFNKILKAKDDEIQGDKTPKKNK